MLQWFHVHAGNSKLELRIRSIFPSSGRVGAPKIGTVFTIIQSMPHIYITRQALVSNCVLDSCKDCYVSKSQPELVKDENYNNFKRKAGVLFKHIIHQNINSIIELHFECAISPNILRNHLDKPPHFMTGKTEIQRL